MFASLVVSLALVLAPAEMLRDPEAKRLFGEAQSAFESGDYATASARLEAAYLIEPQAALLYPWAQAERQLDRCESAITLYEKFLDSKPSERMATAAQSNIDRCKAKLEDPKSEPPPPEPVPGTDDETAPAKTTDDFTADEPPAKKPEGKSRRHFIGTVVSGTLLGVGIVGLIAGGTLLGVASGRAKAMDEASTNTRYDELRRQALAMHTAGITVLAVSGAIALGGVIGLSVIAAKKRRERKSSVAMFLDGRSGGVVWRGRF